MRTLTLTIVVMIAAICLASATKADNVVKMNSKFGLAKSGAAANVLKINPNLGIAKLDKAPGKGPGKGPGDKWPGGKGPGNKWPDKKWPGPKGPWIDPGFHPWKHHHPPYYQPVYVGGATTYYEPDMMNPVPPADIQLVNPAENRVTLRFRINDGELQSLPAGYSVQINQAAVISFDRGGYAGRARYSLTDGAYKFISRGTTWDLIRQSIQAVETASYAGEDANPVPGN